MTEESATVKNFSFGLQAGHSGHGAGFGTQSVCPVCLRTVQAQLRKSGHTVSLAKLCPEHGSFESVVWRGEPRFADWLRPKTPSRPPGLFTERDKGCPHDCGLCPEHRQHTCTALIEITSRCNLRCPVCFADAGLASARTSGDPDMDQLCFLYDRTLEAQGGTPSCNIQLSGGEPTVRDDLPEIIRLGRDKGFPFIQLNTNGLRLAREPGYAEALRDAGLASVFLQFDGVSDAPYLTLRGKALWAEKQRVVQRCGEAGLGVVLVPTLVPGVNDRQLGDILRFALRAGAHVRGVHFQPISYFGRHPRPEGPADSERLTLPEIMTGLEEQTQGLVRTGHFSPPGCEHALCSFHGNYLRTADGGLQPLSHREPCCPSPVEAKEGARKSIAYTARQWAAPACGCTPPQPGTAQDLGKFLDQARAWMFSISAMAFQDAWTLDLERLKGCCIHVVSPDGRLVPFCAYNLTAVDGTPLYRSRETP